MAYLNAIWYFLDHCNYTSSQFDSSCKLLVFEYPVQQFFNMPLVVVLYILLCDLQPRGKSGSEIYTTSVYNLAHKCHLAIWLQKLCLKGFGLASVVIIVKKISLSHTHAHAWTHAHAHIFTFTHKSSSTSTFFMPFFHLFIFSDWYMHVYCRFT